MRITGQGFRRVISRQDFEAKQNSLIKVSSLVLGAVAGIVGTLTMFTTTPAVGLVEGKSIKVGTASSLISVSSSVESDQNFARQASASVEIRFDAGAANFELPQNWEDMDVYWDAPESISTPFLAKIIERNADASVKLNASVGTADYESTIFWEFMDVNWDEEDTSTASQFTAQVFERTANANITTVVTVGTAGWSSNIEWQNADVEWSEFVAGSILQGNASATISISVNTVNINLIEDWSGETSLWSQKSNNWEAS
tara:strand:- start:9948 stop:10718 length:771 start_codon:yes stop_codon:yes gene_type:complete